MDIFESGKRISLKRARPNPLFQSWIEELHEEAKQKKSKLENRLTVALTSLTKYPLPLQTGDECAILKGFDKRLCMYLDKKLKNYNTYKGISLPTIDCISKENNQGPTSDTFNNSTRLHAAEKFDVEIPNDLLKSNTRVISPKQSGNVISVGSFGKTNSNAVYKPSYRSGGYAILLALLEQSNVYEKKEMDKETLIDNAEKYCDTSFTIRKPNTLYTAWSSMGKLITKGLVKRCKGKKTKYSLTDDGYIIARDLSVNSPKMPTTEDIIYIDTLSPKQLLQNEHYNSKGSQSIEDTSTNSQTSIKNTQIDLVEMAADTFDIVLLIDKNETSGVNNKNDPTVAQFKKYPNICHEYRTLKVGDYVWVARHRINKEQELVLPFIVERKRLDDLAASIKDGRFHEQKFRLKRCGIENVIYLVENYGSKKNVGLPIQSLMQALANTRVNDGFKVHITKSLIYTARFLAMMTKRLAFRFQNKNLKGMNAQPEGTTLMTFDYFNKSTVKNKPLTVTETFIKILLQLKGVSVEKALAITSKYTTPHSLISIYKVCNQKEGEMLLANLKHGELSRNVGPTVSKTIYQLFTKIT